MGKGTVLPGCCRVMVDEDGMKAWLEIKPDTLVGFGCGASAARRTPDAETDEPIYERRACADLDDVLNLLAQHGVVFGILRMNLADILDQAREGLFLAAMGVEPTLSVDEEVEILFGKPGKGRPVRDADGRIKYFELHNLPSVAAGEVLARVRAGIPGKDGKTVTGAAVPAKPPARVFFDAGPGVELVDNGRTARALTAGRPEMIRRGSVYRFSVTPVLQIDEDVSWHTGNIRFKGNVRINGAVNEGLLVMADGDIEVHGAVNGAVLKAKGDVIVHGAVASGEITAGVENRHLEPFLRALDRLIGILGRTILAARDLVDAARERGHPLRGGKAMATVINHKFTRLPEVVRQLDEYRRQALEAGLPLPAQLQDGIESAARMFLNDPETLAGLRGALNLLSRLRFAAGELTSLARPKGNVFVHSVANTFVEAVRGIYVTGCGAYTSVMHAGEDAVIDGVLRGGSLKAGRGVVVNRTGSRRGAGTTEIHLSPGGHARIFTAYPELIIRVDARSTTIRRPLRDLAAHYDDESGRVIAEGIPMD